MKQARYTVLGSAVPFVSKEKTEVVNNSCMNVLKTMHTM